MAPLSGSDSAVAATFPRETQAVLRMPALHWRNAAQSGNLPVD
jgi:hypothetical protein